MIGDRLKVLRSSLGRTQEEVSKAIGVSRAAYSHFENNRNEPDAETLGKLASYYDVTTDYLIGNTSERKPKKVDIDDDDVIMTYQGKPIPDEDLKIIKRLLGSDRDDG